VRISLPQSDTGGMVERRNEFKFWLKKVFIEKLNTSEWLMSGIFSVEKETHEPKSTRAMHKNHKYALEGDQAVKHKINIQ